MTGALQPEDLGLGLDDLIAAVDRLQPESDEIARLQTAVLLSERLGELGDHLVGHFVDEARRVGASWRAIGDGLGVSKQAAQKRFVPTAGDVSQEGFLSRFTPRARDALTAARDTARRLGRAQVGTEHLVAGLIADSQGLSAQAIAAQGVAVAAVLAAVDADGDVPRAGRHGGGTGGPHSLRRRVEEGPRGCAAGGVSAGATTTSGPSTSCSASWPIAGPPAPGCSVNSG